jgi:hypothetical protein
MATEQELEYIAKHPGGFDREFFEEHLGGLIEQWKQWAGEGEYLVRISTKTGASIDIAYGRAAQTYLVAFTEAKQVEIVPMIEMTRISIGRRPSSDPKRQVGFTIEPLEAEAS